MRIRCMVEYNFLIELNIVAITFFVFFFFVSAVSVVVSTALASVIALDTVVLLVSTDPLGPCIAAAAAFAFSDAAHTATAVAAAFAGPNAAIAEICRRGRRLL